MPDELNVAYVLRSWPRLSQTFVLNEILELERLGVRLSIFAMTRAREATTQPQVADVAARVTYLDEPGPERSRVHAALAAASPGRYAGTLRFAMTRHELLGGYTKSSALQAFDAAARVAFEMSRTRRTPYTHIHAHFAHDPALIGLLAHKLTGVPFSFTAHARDLYQIPSRALAGRVHEATAVVTCCRSNVQHINALIRETTPVELVYHGVDLRSFHPLAETNGADEPPLILSVGRLVEKKGFDQLLRALGVLAADGRRFRCEIYGDGPSAHELEALRDRLGLQDVVAFCGARTQTELVAAYRRAAVFALTPRVTDDGDRDGVPNVLLEAMACGVPPVCTAVGGIPEVIDDGRNGLIVPDEPLLIAERVATLLEDAGLRERLGTHAALTAQRFDSRTAAKRLVSLFSHEQEAPS